MKVKITILLVFSVFVSYGQSSFLFFSNLNQDANLKDILFHTKEDVRLFSLGDNYEVENLLNYKRSKHAVLGDTDFYDEVNDNAISFKGIKKKQLCPGPYVEELDEKHVLIRINSNWMLDPEYRYQTANEDCETYNHIHMLEELEDVLEDYSEWNKVLIAHHPIASVSQLNGRGMGWLNLLPIYGQLKIGFKAHVGNAQDMAHPNYQLYINSMNKLLSKFDKLVMLTGHDKVNSIINKDQITHINVNSSKRSYKSEKDEYTDYLSRDAAFLKLDVKDGLCEFSFIKDGQIEVVSDPFKSIQTQESVNSEKAAVNPSTRASEKYHPTKWNTFWMGTGYRKEWSELIKAPLLNIDTYDGGLEPYAIGGGLQTMSIKMKAANGKKYAFRVLDKQPEKSLSVVLRESLYKGIVQELITTMHPYAPLVANHLIDATDIIHIKPELFILDQNVRLTDSYAGFIGKLGTLEEKPKGKKKNRKGFYGADDVVSSYEMIVDLRRSPNHKIDKMAYAKARLMDMYIGDWDRHEDNWKWALFEDGEDRIYRPIPKDRDHVFSHWVGLIPSISDMIIMNAEDFDYTFGNLRHLNFKARFLDRQLATELSLEDWQIAVEYIQSKMTDQLIDEAVLQFPAEVHQYSMNEISAKLKSRREDLPRAIREYYTEFNSSVHLAASNKKDLIDIDYLDNGDVRVEIYHKSRNNNPYYHRTFESDLVKNLYVFGLDGKDNYTIKGKAESPIKLSIIGGDDEDEIECASGSIKHKIKVYDSQNEDVVIGDNIKVKSPNTAAQYDPYNFDYNWLIPKVILRRSSGNGIGFGGGFSYLTRGFNKSSFVNKYDFTGLYYPSIGAYRLDGKYTKRQAVSSMDFFVSSRFSTLYDKYPFFYGIGNETTVINKRRKRLNRLDYDYLDVTVGLEETFYTKSKWSNAIVFERHKVLNYKNVTALDATINGFGAESFTGLRSTLELDFTDNSAYPLAGSQLFTQLDFRRSFSNDYTGNVYARFTQYRSVDIGIDVTFAGSLHYNQAVGDVNFYHLSRLGSQTHFRGYTRNRFIDRYGLLYNTEARLNFGYINTPLIRFYIGMFGFYDGGRVWNDSAEFYKGDWNNSYGGGIFISPGNKDYAITLTLAWPDDNFTYSKIQLGFDF